jgi:hypothetical protein
MDHTGDRQLSRRPGKRKKMIKHYFNRVKCYFSGHNLIEAGSCPYTGSVYDYCDKCEMMFPRELAI